MDLSKVKLHQSFDDLKLNYSVSEWSSAVTFLLVDEGIVFIKRSDEMPTHRGQVGFFGGRKVIGESPEQTALREFEEESGIDRSHLSPLGLLQPIYTMGSKLIVPVLCQLNMSYQEFARKAVSNGEWSYHFLVDVDTLGEKRNWVSGKSFSPKEYDLLFCPVLSPDADEGYDLLWGATAKMVWNFFKN